MSTNTTGSLTNEQRIVYYDTVAAELASVTAERDDWKIRAEEMDGYKADCHALRVRVADLGIQRDMDTECIERIRSAVVKAEQRVVARAESKEVQS